MFRKHCDDGKRDDVAEESRAERHGIPRDAIVETGTLLRQQLGDPIRTGTLRWHNGKEGPIADAASGAQEVRREG